MFAVFLNSPAEAYDTTKTEDMRIFWKIDDGEQIQKKRINVTLSKLSGIVCFVL